MSEDSLRRELGAQVRRVRIARGYSLREAAERCGLSFQMLQQIEKYGQNTTIEKLEGIVRGLDAAIELTVAEEVEASHLLAADSGLGERRAIGERFLRVLPYIPADEIDVFLHELALWERRYSPIEPG